MTDPVAALRDGPLPADAAAPVAALWHLARGDWARAHALVQDDDSDAAAWVHAHLHRVEGDLGNADWWYRRCGLPACREALDTEWARIAAALLEGGGGRPVPPPGRRSDRDP